MRAVIDKSWWSKRWLEGLKAADEKGRLKSGRTDWLNGKLISATFHTGTLTLEGALEGSGYFPYEASIGFRPIEREKVDALLAAVSREPRLLAALLKHEFPEALYSLTESLGIDLFPSGFDSLAMHCTCPGKDRPCRHLATLCYELVSAIEEDPFTLFRLRGVDLAAELQAYDISLNPQEEEELPAASALCDVLAGAQVKPFSAPLESLPLYKVDNLDASITSLFDEKYQERRFNQTLMRKLYAAVRELSGALLKSAAGTGAQRAAPQEETPLRGGTWTQFLQSALSLKEGVPFFATGDAGFFAGVLTRQGKVHELAEEGIARLMLALAGLSADDYPHIPAVTADWAKAAKIVLALMRKGAFVPVLCPMTVPGGQGHYVCVHYLPAVMSENVARVCASLEKYLRAREKLWRSRCGSAADEIFSGAEGSAALRVMSALLNGFVTLALSGEGGRDFREAGKVFSRPGQYFLPARSPYVRSLSGYLHPLSPARQHSGLIPVMVIRTGRDAAIHVNLAFRRRERRDETPVPFGKLLTEKTHEDIRYSAISLAEELARNSEVLREVVGNDGKAATLPVTALTGLLFDVIPVMKLLGVEVMLPRKLANLLVPQAQASLSSSTGHVSLLDRDAVFTFNWRIRIGDEELTVAQFRELMNYAGQVVPWVEGEFVYLDAQKMQRIEEAIRAHENTGRLGVLSAVQTGSLEEFEFSAGEGLREEIARLQEIRDIAPPEGLQAVLRPYQQKGYAWLYKNVKLGLGSLIADDMGLGKTLQVITLLLKLKNERALEHPNLVVVPTTLLTNWCRELQKFAPSLVCSVYHGPKRRIDRHADVLLTTYGTLRNDAQTLAREKWGLLVLDEAQAVKNVSTGITRALRSIKNTAGRIAMTGTPVENRLMEFWSIFSIVEPGLLGSEEAFARNVVEPVEFDHDPEAAERFRRLTAPFMLRRLKTDKRIISDLPEKIVSDHYVTLTPDQAMLYEAVLEKMMKDIRRARASEDQNRAGMLVLKLMTELKQICNSPAQLRGHHPRYPDSAKGEALMEILDTAGANAQKVLIFTQYATMGALLQDWIETRTGRRPDFLSGSVPLRRRAEMVDAFQNDPETDCLIVSLKAGGTGLNLVAASVVVHYDLWWNPAVENQATDRAYRIGQKNNVLVYRLLTEGTFEEKINELITAKRELAQLSVGSGEQWIGELPEDELEALFRLRR